LNLVNLVLNTENLNTDAPLPRPQKLGKVGGDLALDSHPEGIRKCGIGLSLSLLTQKKSRRKYISNVKYMAADF